MRVSVPREERDPSVEAVAGAAAARIHTARLGRPEIDVEQREIACKRLALAAGKLGQRPSLHARVSARREHLAEELAAIDVILED